MLRKERSPHGEKPCTTTKSSLHLCKVETKPSHSNKDPVQPKSIREMINKIKQLTRSYKGAQGNPGSNEDVHGLDLGFKDVHLCQKFSNYVLQLLAVYCTLINCKIKCTHVN